MATAKEYLAYFALMALSTTVTVTFVLAIAAFISSPVGSIRYFVATLIELILLIDGMRSLTK